MRGFADEGAWNQSTLSKASKWRSQVRLWVKLWDWTKSWEKFWHPKTVDPELLTKVKPVMMWWCRHFSIDVISCHCTSFLTDFQHLTITTLEDILCSHSLRSFFLPFNASSDVGDWMRFLPKVVQPGMWSNWSHSSAAILQHCRKLNSIGRLSFYCGTDWDFPCDVIYDWFVHDFSILFHSALDVISGDLHGHPISTHQLGFHTR